MNDLLMKDLIKELRANRTSDLEIANRDIAARDRVDISLEKYEQMRDEIEELQAKVRDFEGKGLHLESLLIKIGIPEKILYEIRPEDIEIVTYKNPENRTISYNIRLVVMEEDRRSCSYEYEEI